MVSSKKLEPGRIHRLAAINGKKGNGKGDIWVGVGEHCFTIEAKAVWPGSSVVEAIKGVKKKLEAAVSQLRSLHPNISRWGASRALLRHSRSESKRQIRERF